MPYHANSGSFKKGHTPWSAGSPLPKSTKEKIRAKAIEPEKIAQSIAHLPQTRRGCENPNWKGGLRTKTCLYCEKQFQVTPTLFDKAKYCSRLCQNRAKHREGKENPNWSGGHYKNCEYCGEEFWAIPSSKQRYCSPSCASKAKGVFARLNNNLEFQQKRLQAAIKQPNKQERKLETLLEKWFPSEWKFVGDGEVILGGLNPDFINCNGKKQIIEFFGCWYHGCPIHHPEKKVHWQDTEVGKKVIFSRYGFQTLVIWEHELGDERAIVEKVLCFRKV